MKTMLFYGSLFVCLFISKKGIGQTYFMSNGSISACSGTFYDSGGGGADYGMNENSVFTICPATVGDKVQVDFTSFSIESGYDYFYVFDGANTSASSLGTYTGTSSPGLTQATIGNTSGCLTFQFTSDNIVAAPGWEATVSCYSVCQSITANLDNITPAADGDGIVRLCQGETFSVQGSGTFSNSGTGATYTWNMSDGTRYNGTTASHSYATEGVYFVILEIEDPNNCTNTNRIAQEIQVSTTPALTTTANADTSCLGSTVALAASALAVTSSTDCTPSMADTTFLPDGTGTSYTTTINVSCYDMTDTIANAMDIENVRVVLEHSYLGDLDIELRCPSGQAVKLHTYDGVNGSGNGLYLGAPFDDPSSDIGSGFTYLFEDTASLLLLNGPTISAGSPASLSIDSGVYRPSMPFSNFVGCPLNGDWSIVVTDNLAQDNGYIFDWEVNFAASTSPITFTPVLTSEMWRNDPVLTSNSPTTADVTPTTTGNFPFYFEVNDNFGCTYQDTQAVVIETTTKPTTLILPAVNPCPKQLITLEASGGAESTGGQVAWYTAPNGGGLKLGAGSALTTSLDTTTTLYIRREGGCLTSVDTSVQIQVKNYIYGLNNATSNMYCTDVDGWHHFYSGDEILLSIQGDLSGAPVGYPEISIYENGSFYQENQGPVPATTCVAGGGPGEERFEMRRAWNVDFGGGTLNPPYNVRFYHRANERTEVENAAANWLAAYPYCNYSYKVNGGFYWFKNTNGNYTAPSYEGDTLSGTTHRTLNDVNYVELTGINSFSGGSGAVVLSSSNVLPLGFLSFSGESETKGNRLVWLTEKEQNVHYFEVLRSYDGIAFERIGQQKALGYSTSTQKYEFLDEASDKTWLYYKIRAVDYDGAAQETDVLALYRASNNQNYRVFPNPTTGAIYYETTLSAAGPLTFEWADISGKSLLRYTKVLAEGPLRESLDLTPWPRGIYLLRVVHSDGTTHRMRVVKE